MHLGTDWHVKDYQREGKDFEDWIKTRLEDSNRKKKTSLKENLTHQKRKKKKIIGLNQTKKKLRMKHEY